MIAFLNIALLILGFFYFVQAARGVQSRLNQIAAGLACWILTSLIAAAIAYFA